jgi:hypothetical protein
LSKELRVGLGDDVRLEDVEFGAVEHRYEVDDR